MSRFSTLAASITITVLAAPAIYVAGQHWWLHALRQPAVLAQTAAPARHAVLAASHTGVSVMVSMAPAIGR